MTDNSPCNCDQALELKRNLKQANYRIDELENGNSFWRQAFIEMANERGEFSPLVDLAKEEEESYEQKTI